MSRNQQVIGAKSASSRFQLSPDTAIFSIRWYIEGENIDATKDRLDLRQQAGGPFLGTSITQLGSG